MEWIDLYDSFYDDDDDEKENELAWNDFESVIIQMIDVKSPFGTPKELGISKICERCGVEFERRQLNREYVSEVFVELCKNCSSFVFTRIVRKSNGTYFLSW